MRRFLLVICFLGSFSIATLLHCYIATNAQTFDFNKAYQDYLYNFNLYRDSHLRYVSAKGEYQNYKTLNAETKALEATREMLQKRAETLRTYLTALRLKLVETTGVTNYEQSLAFVKLDTEIRWLAAHKDSLTSPGSIDDLVKASSNLEQKYPNIELLAYQTLGTILSGKENSLREKVSSQAEKTAEKLAQMKKEGEEVDKASRWLLEAKKKITLSQEKQREAETAIKAIKESNTDKNKDFNKAQFAYEESNQYLKEAVSFLVEIVSEIKHE